MANRIEDQAVFLGPSGAFAGYNESSLAYPGELGKIARDADKTYQLVQVSGDQGLVNQLAFWRDRSAFLVSSSATHQDAGRNSVAGVFLGTAGAGNYTWVQKKGEHNVVATSGSVTTGTQVVAISGSNGVITQATASATVFQVVGTALTASTGSAVTSVDLAILED